MIFFYFSETYVLSRFWADWPHSPHSNQQLNPKVGCAKRLFSLISIADNFPHTYHFRTLSTEWKNVSQRMEKSERISSLLLTRTTYFLKLAGAFYRKRQKKWQF